ncbi:hypothetical protein [Microbacterium sp. MTN4-26]|uniref:hypothetical protein n=1 Tax=unclassified Microbacterium TaxID=2609290 RepID=UPI0036F27380
MDREELKKARLQLLPILARTLPRVMQFFKVGPLLLGDAAIQAFTLGAGKLSAKSFLALPLSPDQLVAFSDREISSEYATQIARSLVIEVATESTVVIDGPDAPVINGQVLEMWHSQPQRSGEGLPHVVRIFDSPKDMPEYQQVDPVVRRRAGLVDDASVLTPRRR